MYIYIYAFTSIQKKQKYGRSAQFTTDWIYLVRYWFCLVKNVHSLSMNCLISEWWGVRKKKDLLKVLCKCHNLQHKHWCTNYGMNTTMLKILKSVCCSSNVEILVCILLQEIHYHQHTKSIHLRTIKNKCIGIFSLHKSILNFLRVTINTTKLNRVPATNHVYPWMHFNRKITATLGWL